MSKIIMKRRGETLTEFLAAMAVAGMLFLMISQTMQRAVASVTSIHAKDALRQEAEFFLAAIPVKIPKRFTDPFGQENFLELMKDEVYKNLGYRAVTVDVEHWYQENGEAKSLLSFDLIMSDDHNNSIVLRGIKRFISHDQS